MAPHLDMREFWDERAREDAFFFVDSRLRYGDPDLERFWHGGEEVLRRMVDDFGLRIAPTATVVDIGCGLGRVSRALARRAGRVVALDVSAEMLARAQELNADLAGVEWRLGDGRSLAGVEDASVDACLSVVVFQHVPDPAITLGYIGEIGRVLRRGGWASIQVSTDPGLHGRRLWARLRRLLPGNRGRGPRGLGHPAWRGSAIDLGELAAAAASAGLEVERVSGAGTQFCLVALRKT